MAEFNPGGCGRYGEGCGIWRRMGGYGEGWGIWRRMGDR